VGNLTNVIDSVMGTWNYGYDPLNRLTTSQNTATTSTSSQYAGYSLCWAYDSFGNRTAQQIQTSPCPASESSVLPTESYNASNQIADGLHAYDASGDIIADATTGNQYLYDAEGRICAESSTPVPGFTSMTGYVYDAEGNRVAKGTITSWSCDPSSNGLMTAGNETDYILGPGGEQVTELAQDANGSMNWQRTYVYAGGALIATYDPTPDSPNQPLPSFRLTDWLGTMRVTTDSAGVAQSTCTGLPFGDGQTCQGNIPDQRYFTGKERDTESGNDYFGARYFASSMGRMLSPDPLGGSLANPQSLNRYAYALNNPLRFTDPTGMYTQTACTGDKDTVATCNQTANDVEKRIKSDIKSKDPERHARGLAYGQRGVANGITVTIGDPGNGHGGNTVVTGMEADPDNPGKFKATADVTIRPGESGATLDSDVDHEGQHVVDANTFAATVTQDGHYDLSKNLTEFQTEMNGYRATNSVLGSEGVKGKFGRFGDCPCTLGGLPNPDPTIRKLLADPRNGYGVDETNQGPRQFPEITTPNPVPQQ
jgi:RHS repeat-associated protein